jgi:glycerophosphoryl diester phosphodiesterase
VSRPLVIAHRGASGHEVENSLAAFRLAAEQGADAVELDVHSTADGALVVRHGMKVGDLRIAHSTLAQLRALPLPNGEPVPTLDEALAVIVPRMIACVELKLVSLEGEERLIEAIERTRAPDRVALHAFDHRVIRRMGERRPFLRRGVIQASYPVQPVRCLEDADASVLWQEKQYVDQALVAAMHRAGLRVYVWTVDDPEEIRHLAVLGVDGICTDFPDVARSVFASLPA